MYNNKNRYNYIVHLQSKHFEINYAYFFMFNYGKYLVNHLLQYAEINSNALFFRY